ncbi:hypothetical protein ACFSKL_15560 [Belliella marina]|uniref:Tetratricopeptide repeat protein n=1 Tax=Belliella marina TaxID=1644146 RepID=A0ABW4VRJ8_9BACT
MLIVSRILFLILLFVPGSWMEISKKNAAIKAAEKSYSEAKYEKSVEDHLALLSDFNVNSPEANFNLALSYQYAEKPEEAQRTFMSLLSSGNKMISSFSSNHNGMILGKDKKYEEALEAFKYALIKDPSNESARYNYELLARWLEENKDQEDQDNEDQNEDNEEDQDNENQDQEQDNQDQEKKDENKKNGEGEDEADNDEDVDSEQKDDKDGEKSQNEKDSQEPSDLESDLSDREKAQEQLKEKLKEMNLTPEQAAQILDAMNAAELRYIQQNRKKPTKKADRSLPEW